MDPVPYMVFVTGIICVFHGVQSVGSTCISVPGLIQDNERLKNNTYRSVLQSTLFDCASQCLRSSACVSFGFDINTRTCNLNSKDSTTASLVPQVGNIHSDIQKWPKSLMGPCANVTCPAKTACSVDRNDMASCIDEFQGCGSPPETNGVKAVSQGVYLGAETRYSCLIGEALCSPTNVIRCLASGSWEPFSGSCATVLWENPPIPFLKVIPCYPTGDMHLSILGTPTKNTDFAINIGPSTDVSNELLIHINVRFKYMADVKKVIMNSYTNGRWDESLTASLFPFVVGEQFSSVLTLSNELFTFTVNGTEVFTFQQRATGQLAHILQIYGDVEIQTVNFTVKHGGLASHS